MELAAVIGRLFSPRADTTPQTTRARIINSNKYFLNGVILPHCTFCIIIFASEGHNSLSLENLFRYNFYIVERIWRRGWPVHGKEEIFGVCRPRRRGVSEIAYRRRPHFPRTGPFCRIQTCTVRYGQTDCAVQGRDVFRRLCPVAWGRRRSHIFCVF